MIPETTSYRYDHHGYPSAAASLHSSRPLLSTGFRPMNHHQAVNQWDSSESAIDPYVSPRVHRDVVIAELLQFSGLQERALVGHAPPNDAHTRY